GRAGPAGGHTRGQPGGDLPRPHRGRAAGRGGSGGGGSAVNGVLSLSLAVARTGWLAAWNRLFRFSRVKAGLIWLALQGYVVYVIARRAPAVAPDAAGAGLVGALTLMGAQMAWFGLMYGFSRGQMQLYQGLLVPLFQITPA